MNPRDYKSAWVLPEGREYRMAVYERQRAGGTRPLVDNPTVEKIAVEVRKHWPATVLEVGAGWGRILVPLAKELGAGVVVLGCDASDEILMLSGKAPIFKWDITCALNSPGYWDVVFTRGLFHYFTDEQMLAAMRNIEKLAAKAVLYWELTDTRRRMEKIFKSPKIHYFDVQARDE